MLNSKLDSVLSQQPGLNCASFKFICEICGLITENMDSLKYHLNSHNKTEYRLKPELNHANNNNNDPKETFNQKRHSVNISNSKINSIISNVKLSSPMNTSVINIPQSMTVFNLKEISTKLKNIKSVNINNRETNETIDNKTLETILLSKSLKSAATGSSILSVIKPDKNNNDCNSSSIEESIESKTIEANTNEKSFESDEKQHKSDQVIEKSQEVSNSIEISTFKENDNLSVIITADKADREQINMNNIGNNLIINLMPLTPFSSSQTLNSPDKTNNLLESSKFSHSSTNINICPNLSASLPYHYSEFENLYICNLCNCTYDSLRSIKAHLWKHSGHHELSYPIHDYNNRSLEQLKPSVSPSTNQTANQKPSISLKRPISRNFQLPISSKQILNTTEPASSLDDGLISIKKEMFQLLNEPAAALSTNEIQKMSDLPTTSCSLVTSPTNTNRGNCSSGGICSVLLEVIEKLRDEESTSSSSGSSKNDSLLNSASKAKKPKQTTTNTKRTKTIKKPLKLNNNNRIRNLMQLRIKQTPDENIDKNSEKGETNLSDECKIETSVVSSLFDDDQAGNLDEPKQFSYVCLKCLHLFGNKSSLNEHKNDNCQPKKLTKKKRKLAKTKISKQQVEKFFQCEFCTNEFFTEMELLLEHCKNSHEKEVKNVAECEIEDTNNTNSNCIRSRSSSSLSLTIEFDSSSSSDSNNSLTSNNTKQPTSNNDIKMLLSNLFKNGKILDTIIKNNNNNDLENFDLVSLLSSLASNDGFEQYVCGFCSHVCYHLPSLKSHMWTHVKNIKFDYSVNTAIINAALDYENKLNRKLNLIKKSKLNLSRVENSESAGLNHLDDEIKEDFGNNNNNNKSVFLERQLISALELINYPANVAGLSSDETKGTPMISFRCSRCGYETIDLSLLRLHKREHYLKIVNNNNDNDSIEDNVDDRKNSEIIS